MFAIDYMDSKTGERVNKEFDSYPELVYYVAAKGVDEKNLISLTLAGETIFGIDGLVEFTKKTALESIIAQAMLEEEIKKLKKDMEDPDYIDLTEEDFEDEEDGFIID